MKKIILFFAMTFLLTSCSITKRHYMPGYSISFNKKPSRILTDTITDLPENKKSVLTASLDNEIVEPESLALEDTCDILIMKTGEEIQGLITEVSDSEVKYKKCDNLKGPTIIIKKSTVLIAKYANGTKEVFKNSETSTSTKLAHHDKELNGISIFALLVAIFGAVLGIISIIGTLVSGGLAFILSIVAMGVISNHIETQKGIGLAVLAMILALGDIVGGILLILLLI